VTDPQTSVPFALVDGVVVDVPSDADASAIGRMQLESWHQTYPSAEHGIDADWISEHMGSRTSPAADEFRRSLLAAQRADPANIFYRVARSGGEIVGFVQAARAVGVAPTVSAPGDASADSQGAGDHGREDATLEALYLLHEYQGTGLSGHMMAAVLDWLGDQAMRLEVASYNARAIRFYQRDCCTSR